MRTRTFVGILTEKFRPWHDVPATTSARAITRINQEKVGLDG